eukprot:TRINITY_DN17412_c0_g3_i2.p1 TRINITY_DN17412_c0_g3~~TRINITY_DN17412_c0_g3_i2.p1  ORF type:complete len:1226 (-),score=292.06 TRINITY_DN17412_c0_g3_i2:270-3947(-)
MMPCGSGKGLLGCGPCSKTPVQVAAAADGGGGGGESSNQSLHETTDWPSVVVLSPSLWDDSPTGSTFEEFLLQLGLESQARHRVHYLVGSSTSKRDLDRAKVGSSCLTFVVGDTTSVNPDEDDAQIVFTALTLSNLYPGLRLRVMLDRPESKNLAVQSGIEVTRCFSTRELKANILAMSVRCHGAIPMLYGLCKSGDADDIENFLGALRHKQSRSRVSETFKNHAATSSECLDGNMNVDNVGNWMMSFFEGLKRSAFGFELSGDYHGKSFEELAMDVYTTAGAVLLGIFEDGYIQICPQLTHIRPLRRGQICFAVASSASVLHPFRMRGAGSGDWKAALYRSRDLRSKRSNEEGVHVEVAKLLRHQLQNSALPHDKGQVRVMMRESVMGYAPGCEVYQRQPSLLQTNVLETGRFARQWSGGLSRHGEARWKIEQLRRNKSGNLDDLAVVIVCNGQVWQQVRTFVGALRASYLPQPCAVVVFVAALPSHSVLSELGEGVLVLEGSCLSAKDLFDAGMAEAKAMVVMSGEPMTESLLHGPLFRDYKAVLVAQELECWCSFLPREVFTLYELQDSRSCTHLPTIRSVPVVSYADLLADPDEQLDSDSDAEEDTCAADGTVTRASTIEGIEEEELQNDNEPSWFTQAFGQVQGGRPTDDVMMFHPRFAAGQVFTTEVWGAMLGRMFYMPALIELVEALVMPNRRGQSAFSWQLSIPAKYVGKRLSTLFRDLLFGGWWQNDEEEALASLKREDSGADQQSSSEGPAVPLALYRLRGDLSGPASKRENRETIAEGTGAAHYTVLAPTPTCTLRGTDWVYVLGSKDFGRKADEKGYLRGSRVQAKQECQTTYYSSGRRNFSIVSDASGQGAERGQIGGAILQHHSGLQPAVGSEGLIAGTPGLVHSSSFCASHVSQSPRPSNRSSRASRPSTNSPNSVTQKPISPSNSMVRSKSWGADGNNAVRSPQQSQQLQPSSGPLRSPGSHTGEDRSPSLNGSMASLAVMTKKRSGGDLSPGGESPTNSSKLQSPRRSSDSMLAKTRSNGRSRGGSGDFSRLEAERERVSVSPSPASTLVATSEEIVVQPPSPEKRDASGAIAGPTTPATTGGASSPPRGRPEEEGGHDDAFGASSPGVDIKFADDEAQAESSADAAADDEAKAPDDGAGPTPDVTKPNGNGPAAHHPEETDAATNLPSIERQLSSQTPGGDDDDEEGVHLELAPARSGGTEEPEELR